MNTKQDPMDINYSQHLEDWTYHIYPIDSPSELFGPFADIVDMYRSKIKFGKLASWQNIDFYDFVGWHGRVGVMDRLDDPFDMRVRLFGTTVAEYFDDDLTGKLISTQEGESEESIQQDLIFFKAALELPGIGVAYGPASWLDKSHRHFTLIYIPLANDEHNADQLLTIVMSSSPEAPMIAN